MTSAPTMSSDVQLIARREVTARVHDRGFKVSTVISLVVIAAVAILPKVFGGGTSSWEIAAVGTDATAVAESVAAVAPEDRDTTVQEFADADAARAAVDAGDVDVAVFGDGAVVGREEVDAQLAAALQQAWTAQRLSTELEARGVSPDEVRDLLSTAPPAVELLDPPDVERDRRVGFAAVGSILLFMQLIGFGIWVAMSIVEDKTSQVIEILLAKVPARTLLTGKVVGIGAIGVVQLAAMVAVGLVAFTLADRFPVPPGVWPLAAVLLVAFVLAYLLYASLFAIGGALAARVDDVQSTTSPFTLVMTASYIGAIVAQGDPDGALARWLSMVPFSSPLVMPLRIADGSAAWWEITLSVLLVVASAAALILLADRVYRAGALRTRRTVKLRHALRAEGAPVLEPT